MTSVLGYLNYLFERITPDIYAGGYKLLCVHNRYILSSVHSMAHSLIDCKFPGYEVIS